MMKGDLISRSALTKEFMRLGLGEHGLVERLFADGVYAVVETFPAVDAETYLEQLELVKEAFDMAKSSLVPVVRCKDCKHSYKGSPHGLMCECPVGGQNTSLLGGDDFCSNGERRENHDE